MVGAGQGRGMALQGNGMGVAWARHAMCESALKSTNHLCIN